MPKTPVKIGREDIFETNSPKNLGVFIDKGFNYKSHFQHTCRKIAKPCGSLNLYSLEIEYEFEFTLLYSVHQTCN